MNKEETLKQKMKLLKEKKNLWKDKALARAERLIMAQEYIDQLEELIMPIYQLMRSTEVEEILTTRPRILHPAFEAQLVNDLYKDGEKYQKQEDIT